MNSSAAETAGSRSAGLAFLALDGDCFVVEADDAGIGESDTKDVAGENTRARPVRRRPRR